MYTFKLDIGSLSVPVKGSGYISVSVIRGSSGLVKYRDEKFFRIVRKKLTGALLFKGDEYTALKSLYDNDINNVNIKIYHDSVEVFKGDLLLSGFWDENKKLCQLSATAVDQYSDFYKNINVDINVVGLSSHQISIRYTSTVLEPTMPCFKGSRGEFEFAYDPNGVLSSDPLTRHSDWQFYEENGSTYCGVPGTYQYRYITTYLNFDYAGYTQSVLYPSQYFKKATAAENVYVYLERAKKLYDALTGLLTQVDSSISINESTYSDYINDSSNNIYNLYIMDKSDAKRNDESGATSEFLELTRLLDLYYDWFGLSYKIDSSNVFTLEQSNDIEEANYTTYPKHNLTSYNGVNLTNNLLRYTTDISKKVCREVWSFEKINAIFFDETELVYDIYTDAIKEYAYSDFNNNINVIRYDLEASSDSGFTMFACNNDDIVINTNSLTGTSLVNGVLSAQMMVYRQRSTDRPFAAAVQDGNNVTLEKAEDKKVEFNVPVYNIDDINFEYYLLADLGLIIADEVTSYFDGRMGVIKGRVSNQLIS